MWDVLGIVLPEVISHHDRIVNVFKGTVETGGEGIVLQVELIEMTDERLWGKWGGLVVCGGGFGLGVVGEWLECPVVVGRNHVLTQFRPGDDILHMS